MRKEHVHPLPQPDERPDSERTRRRRGALPRAEPLRPRHRRRLGAPLDRDGLPAAEPVSEVDLRQRRVGTARPRDAQGPRRAYRARAQAGRALGRGERSAEAKRAGTLGWPTATALHRARARRRARGDPARRAGVGARPDRDLGDRGSHLPVEARLHDRDRHAQHAAGRARRRHDGVLQSRRARGRLAQRHPRRVRRDEQDLHATLRPAHGGLPPRRRCRRKASSSSARCAGR